MKKILLLAILFTPTLTFAQAWSGILDPVRAVDWSTAGVVGGIPSSGWQNCTTSACNTLFGGTVTATTINNAINSAPNNTVVRLPSGTFSVTCLNISRSNVVLRGQGANLTRLNFTTACTGNGYGTGRAINVGGSQTGSGRFGGVNSANWTAGYTNGTTVITLSSTTGMTAGPIGTGTILFLDQLDDTSDGWPATGDMYVCANTTNQCSNQGGNNYGRSGRAQIQAVTVTAINGSNVTVEPAVSFPNWRSGKTPGAYWNTGSPSSNVGIEDFTVDFTNATGGPVGIWFINTANSWARGLRIMSTADCGGCARYYMWAIQAVHCTFESNYVFGRPQTGAFPLENYMWSDYITSDLLVQNNIFHRPISGILPNDPSGRNVFAYNYVVGGFKGIAGVQLHSGNVMMDLFEGNDMASYMGDIAHARHHFATLFRNLVDGDAQNASETDHGGLDIETGNRFFNVVGNVLGWTSWNTYQVSQALNDNAVYILGWQGNTSGTTVPNDANVLRTLMRWGNWDKVSNANRFVASEVPSTISFAPNPVPATQTLPASFYLSGRPSWWNISIPYPAIGPDVTGGNVSNSPTGGHAYKIPARVCYESTSQTGGVLDFNANTCYPTTVAPPGVPVMLQFSIQ